MRILIATPLYPPEIAEPAPYAKELARRLSESHEVTVVAYTHLPEELPDVRVIAIDKRLPLVRRLALFTRALARASQDADVVYALNGASVELPFLIARLAPHARRIFCIVDTRAHTALNPLKKMLEQLVCMHAIRVIAEVPPARPEILPLAERPEKALARYEKAWDTHIRTLRKEFTSSKP